MGGVARVAIAGCALLTLAACGRDAGAASEPDPLSATAPASSTTVVTSTTGAPTTTLSPEQQDDADIRQPLRDKETRRPQHPAANVRSETLARAAQMDGVCLRQIVSPEAKLRHGQ